MLDMQKEVAEEEREGNENLCSARELCEANKNPILERILVATSRDSKRKLPHAKMEYRGKRKKKEGKSGSALW